MRIHQMTTGLSYGDAVSNHVLEIDRRLKAWGFTSCVYAQHLEPRLAHLAKLDFDYEPFITKTDDLLIYHYSIFSPNLDLYTRSRNHKIVIYHNITPPEFFHGYDRVLERDCRLGRAALSRLRDCDLGLGDSDFNRRDLVSVGVPEERTAVLPLFLDLGLLRGAHRNQALYEEIRGNGKVNLLSVSRIVPNKAFEDLFKIAYIYREAINPAVHLWIVGRQLVRPYYDYLMALAQRLGMSDTVTFTDRVALGDLCAFYSAADVYISASRHEGFGAPLLESMLFDVPALAYASTAVPDTLGPAGVLYSHVDYPVVAEMAHLLATDQGLRQPIIARQRQRLADFAPERVEAQLRRILERVLK